MNKEEYLSLLTSTQALNQSSITLIEALCEDFPYCQLSHMLLTKKRMLTNDIHYESSLQKTAIQVSSRSALYQFLNWEAQEVPALEETPAVSSPAPEETPKETKTPLAIKKITASAQSFSSWLRNQQKTPISNEKEAPKAKRQASDLIDNFVAKAPKIPKPSKKQQKTKSQDLAQSSIKENESLVTETLAKVYLDQGLHDKAIKAYEILSLKYPQKSVFFADQIQKIKELTL